MTKKIDLQEIIKEIERRKKEQFFDWQQGDYKKGWIDALENLKLWILERKEEK